MRTGFSGELEQLRLQVEVMAVRVGEALARMRVVLATGDLQVAARALAADDEIDAMAVSLTSFTSVVKNAHMSLTRAACCMLWVTMMIV